MNELLRDEFLAGSYAAGSGAPRDESQSQAWLMGYDRAENHRKAGLDPFGKPPRIPGLCARDVRKVCNCADSTRAMCPLPKYPPQPQRKPGLLDELKARAKAVFWKYYDHGVDTRHAIEDHFGGAPKARVHMTIRDEDGPLQCSQCSADVEELATVPIKAEILGKEAWIGLCRKCVENLLRGFDA